MSMISRLKSSDATSDVMLRACIAACQHPSWARLHAFWREHIIYMCVSGIIYMCVSGILVQTDVSLRDVAINDAAFEG